VITTARKVFALLGEKTGAFEAIVSEDLDNVVPEKLKQLATGDLDAETEPGTWQPGTPIAHPCHGRYHPSGIADTEPEGTPT